MTWRDSRDDFDMYIQLIEHIAQPKRVNLDLWDKVIAFLTEQPHLHDESVWWDYDRTTPHEARDIFTKHCKGSFIAWAAIIDGARPCAGDMMYGQGVQVHVVLDQTAEIGTAEYAHSKVLIGEYGQLALGLTMDEAKWINDLMDEAKVLDVMRKTANKLREQQ